MLLVKKLQRISVRIISLEEAQSAFDIFMLTENLPEPSYRINHREFTSTPSGPISRYLSKKGKSSPNIIVSNIRILQNAKEIRQKETELANLKKEFLERFRHSWQITSKEISEWANYIKLQSPINKQNSYEAYINFAKINIGKWPKSLRCATKEPIKNNITRFDHISNDEKGKTSFWIYKGYEYAISGSCTEEEAKLLIFKNYNKEKSLLKKSSKIDVNPINPDKYSENAEYLRSRIPTSVRDEVWRRDQGKCAHCGSREKLEFDHIVPVSRGGSNTARNIELLCEKCNRSKSNNIV